MTASRSSGGVVSVESRVAIAIRLLAGGSYLDLVDIHGVSTSTAYLCMWCVIDAINNTTGVGDMCFPQDSKACRQLAAGFTARSGARGCLDGVVGAVDGLFVRTEAPATTESLNTNEYYSDQKKGFGFNVQAIAGPNYRFMSLTVQNPGSTNDFSAFTRSAAWKLTQKLPPGYFVIGDAAYPLAENLLTPYPGKRLDADRDVFNFYLSQLRMTVEQSFGILVQTWGILWKPLRVKFTGRADVVNAVCRLHNFLRDEGVQ
ncbi:unnamed protein product, partial [Ascophyllum nodosum]